MLKAACAVSSLTISYPNCSNQTLKGFMNFACLWSFQSQLESASGDYAALLGSEQILQIIWGSPWTHLHVHHRQPLEFTLLLQSEPMQLCIKDALGCSGIWLSSSCYAASAAFPCICSLVQSIHTTVP